MSRKTTPTPSHRPGTPMNATAAARIQSANAPAHGGQTPAKSFPARAQSAGAHNARPSSRSA